MRRWWSTAAVSLAVAVAAAGVWWFAAGRPDDSPASVTAGPASTSSAVPGAPSATPSATSPATSPASPSPAPSPSGQVSVRRAEPTGRSTGPLPVQVRIPALGVVAAVDPVGVRPDGAMVVPRSVDRVGWYRYGPPPGAPAGSAVVAGHVNSRTQGPGALARLGQLRVGDRVDVRLGNGKVVRYAVTGTQTLVKKRLPTERLFDREGKARLVLITCGGPFVPALSSYRDNVVVTAEPVGGTR